MTDNSAGVRTLSLSIYRYNPAVNDKPYMQEYKLDIPEKSDPMLLSLLERLKAEQDPTISYRRSCREGVCGSDGMNINGTNGLACITTVSQLKTDKIVIRPLPGFPVVRDLVVDMSQFYQQYERVEPYLQNDTLAPARERLQSPEDRALLDGLYECILCACCTSSCPSFWWNPEKFVGPAGLLQARRFLADSRDTATNHRLEKLQDPFSVFRCRTIMNCTTVCPKGLNPSQAISEIRKQMLNQET
jgi:succinate dehydrogenase / fumarate reductase iron-sulfur subunit